MRIYIQWDVHHPAGKSKIYEDPNLVFESMVLDEGDVFIRIKEANPVNDDILIGVAKEIQQIKEQGEL